MSGFIGTGLPRSGTMSLAMIMKGCKNTEVYHERHGQFPRWKSDRYYSDKLAKLLSTPNFYVEVHFAFMGQISYIRKLLPNLRIVCTHRDRESHLVSLRKHWRSRPEYATKPLARSYIWDKCLPYLSNFNPAKYDERLIDYYEIVSQRIKPPVLHINLLEFNTKAGLTKLFDFVQIPIADRNYEQPTRYNYSGTGKKEHHCDPP